MFSSSDRHLYAKNLQEYELRQFRSQESASSHKVKIFQISKKMDDRKGRNLPSRFHKEFEIECEKIDRGELIPWEASTTSEALRSNPKMLLEPRFDDETEFNLTHFAALTGRDAFLASILLIRGENVNEEEGERERLRQRQKLAFFSVLARDKEGCTPLSIAVKTENVPVVKVLFECYAILLSQEYAAPFTLTEKGWKEKGKNQVRSMRACEATGH